MTELRAAHQVTMDINQDGDIFENLRFDSDSLLKLSNAPSENDLLDLLISNTSGNASEFNLEMYVPSKKARLDAGESSLLKKEKKKERSRIKEQERRNRLNERIDELKQILPQRRAPHAKRTNYLSKEEVLAETFDYVRTLQEEINRLKSNGSSEGAESDLHSSDNDNSEHEQPVNRIRLYTYEDKTPSQEQLKATFQVMWAANISLLWKDVERAYNTCCFLDELSQKIDDESYFFRSIFMMDLYYTLGSPNPVEQIKQLERGLERCKFSDMYLDDVGDMYIVLTGEKGMALAVQGFIDESNLLKNEVTTMVFAHESEAARLSFISWMWVLSYIQGDRITLSQALKDKEEVKGSMPVNEEFANVGLSWALVLAGHPKEALELVDKPLEHGSSILGINGDVVYAPIILLAFLTAKEFAAGLERVDKLLTRTLKGGSGPTGRGELLRLKGELLFGAFSESRDLPLLFPSLAEEEELAKIEGFFLTAMEEAAKKRLKTMELKAALSLVGLWERVGITKKLKDSIRLLFPIFQEIASHCKNHIPWDMQCAQRYFPNHPIGSFT